MYLLLETARKENLSKKDLISLYSEAICVVSNYRELSRN